MDYGLSNLLPWEDSDRESEGEVLFYPGTRGSGGPPQCEPDTAQLGREGPTSWAT